MSQNRRPSRILVIEDDSAMRSLLGDFLMLQGYSTEVFEQATHVISEFQGDHEEVDLIISDVNMPHMNGYQFVEKFHQLRPKTPVILISAFGSAKAAQDAENAGAAAFLNKPFKLSELNDAISSALDTVA